MTLAGLPSLDHSFRRSLDELDLGVRTLSALVVDAIPSATDAFLRSDQELARRLQVTHEDAKALPAQIEAAVMVDIARHSPMGSDLRFLVTVLRVAPALGRCLELVDHIAARGWVSPLLPAEAATSLAGMGVVATAMWEAAALAWRETDATGASRLNEMDDDLVVAVAGLPELLRHPCVTSRVAMQAAMVGRFYERLGAHAVDFARRTRWFAIGE